MTDISARLRSWIKNESQESDPAAIIEMAADEIDRLFRLIGKAADQMSDLEHENIRLRAMCGLAPNQPIPEMMS